MDRGSSCHCLRACVPFSRSVRPSLSRQVIESVTHTVGMGSIRRAGTPEFGYTLACVAPIHTCGLLNMATYSITYIGDACCTAGMGRQYVIQTTYSQHAIKGCLRLVFHRCFQLTHLLNDCLFVICRMEETSSQKKVRPKPLSLTVGKGKTASTPLDSRSEGSLEHQPMPYALPQIYIANGGKEKEIKISINVHQANSFV